MRQNFRLETVIIAVVIAVVIAIFVEVVFAALVITAVIESGNRRSQIGLQGVFVIRKIRRSDYTSGIFLGITEVRVIIGLGIIVLVESSRCYSCFAGARGFFGDLFRDRSRDHAISRARDGDLAGTTRARRTASRAGRGARDRVDRARANRACRFGGFFTNDRGGRTSRAQETTGALRRRQSLALWLTTGCIAPRDHFLIGDDRLDFGGGSKRLAHCAPQHRRRDVNSRVEHI